MACPRSRPAAASPLCLAAFAFPVPLGAGKGPTHVAEQLAFQERLRNSGAVDRHKIAGQATGFKVNRPGQHLFAYTAFAGQADGGPWETR